MVYVAGIKSPRSSNRAVEASSAMPSSPPSFQQPQKNNRSKESSRTVSEIKEAVNFPGLAERRAKPPVPPECTAVARALLPLPQLRVCDCPSARLAKLPRFPSLPPPPPPHVHK